MFHYWNMDFNPYLKAGAPGGDASKGSIEKIDAIRNIAWQTRAALPTEYENALGDLLEKAETDFGIWVNGDLGVEVPISMVRFGAGVRAHYGAMAGGDGSDVEHSGLGGFASLTLIAP